MLGLLLSTAVQTLRSLEMLVVSCWAGIRWRDVKKDTIKSSSFLAQ